MSLLGQLLDYANHLVVCRRGTRALSRRLEALPTTLVGAKTGAPLFVRGHLKPHELLVTPLSGSRVVGYRVVIEVPSRYWVNRRVLVDFCRLAPSTLEPSDGGDAVELAGTSIQILVEKPCIEGRRAGGTAEEPKGFPKEVVAVLADQAQIRADARDTKPYRWGEYHLHGDEEVWIEGALADASVPKTDVTASDASVPESGLTAPGAEADDASPTGTNEKPGMSHLTGIGERPLWLTAVPRDALFAALVDPDEHWLRALPRHPLSDRTTD